MDLLQMCAEGQPRYTLLKKEKINLQTGESIIQYDWLTPKPKETRKEEGREEK